MIFDDLFSSFSEMIFNGCLPSRRRDLLGPGFPAAADDRIMPL